MLIEFSSATKGKKIIINTDRITSVYMWSDEYTNIRCNKDESLVDMTYENVRKVLHHHLNDGIIKAIDYV